LYWVESVLWGSGMHNHFQFFCTGHCRGQRILEAERGWCGIWL